MAQGLNRAKYLRDLDLALRRRALESFGDFPSGMTYQDLGLPADFQLVPGLSPLQNIGVEGAEGLFQAGGLAGEQSGALSRIYSGEPGFQMDPVARERYFREQVEIPTMRTFQQDILPAIAERYAPGGRTGAFMQGIGTGLADLGERLGAQRAAFLRQDELQAYQSQENALQRMLGLAGLGGAPFLSPYSGLAELGGVERGIAGQMRAEQLQRGIMAQPWGDPRWGMFPTMLGLNPLPVGAGGRGSSLGGLAQLAGTFLAPQMGFGAGGARAGAFF